MHSPREYLFIVVFQMRGWHYRGRSEENTIVRYGMLGIKQLNKIECIEYRMDESILIFVYPLQTKNTFVKIIDIGFYSEFINI